MQRGVEGALLDFQDLFRNLLNPLGNRPAVFGFKRNGFEDEKVECALNRLSQGVVDVSRDPGVMMTSPVDLNAIS